MNWCVPWKFVSGAENPVLHELQFHYMGICSKSPGGTGMSHHRPNESFIEGQFNVSAYLITFEQGM
jgi:hypothetical protein